MFDMAADLAGLFLTVPDETLVRIVEPIVWTFFIAVPIAVLYFIYKLVMWLRLRAYQGKCRQRGAGNSTNV